MRTLHPERYVAPPKPASTPPPLYFVKGNGEKVLAKDADEMFDLATADLLESVRQMRKQSQAADERKDAANEAIGKLINGGWNNARPKRVVKKYGPRPVEGEEIPSLQCPNCDRLYLNKAALDKHRKNAHGWSDSEREDMMATIEYEGD